ncbi:MAG: surface lipoprotein assembly modifier [Pseudomonadota bacterium]
MIKKITLVLCLVGWLYSGVALAEGPDLDKAQAMLQEGKYAEAYSLLEPFEFEKSGDLTFDYLLGTAALNSGNPSKATFIFERILAQEPNYVGVRLDMARAYYEMGDYARAKIEFETVIVFENLPPDLKSAADQYLAAIKQLEAGAKTILAGYIEGTVGRDNNVNSSPSQTPIFLPGVPMFYDMPVSSLKTPDKYLGVAAGLEVNHQSSNQVSFYLGADLSGRGYDSQTSANTGTVSGRFGVNISEGAWLFRTGLNGSTSQQHGLHYYDTDGANLDVRYQINPSNQLNASGQLMRLHFVDPTLVAQNYEQSSLTLGWMYAYSGVTVLTLSATAGSEQAPNGRSDGGKRFTGVRAGWQSSLTETIGAFLSVGVQRSKYDTQNSLFLVNRDDKFYDLSAGVTWGFAQVWSLRPQVAYTRSESNVAFNNYNRTDLSLNLRRSF